jgi:tRNA-Thr(GGU) m(6)t(6)A37 methyltransferase TsaA
METTFVMKPIGVVKNTRIEPTDDYWGSISSVIELNPEIPEESLTGIEGFSHLEVLFNFNKADEKNIAYMGYPRNNPQWPMTGIFATRKKDRPNHIGLTIVTFVKRVGKKIFVRNLDAIDGTPVLDIKPVIKEFLPDGEIRQPFWASEVMKNYWKE